jgi:hypothetical protein
MGSHWKKVLLGVGAVLVLAFGLIGFAHTKPGRPLLAYMPWAPPGCPVDMKNVDPIAVEKFRREQLEKNQGTEAAKSHPALGFVLGQTTTADIDAFVAAHADRCEQKRKGTVYECKGVSLDDGPVIDDLHLQLDDQGRLVAVNAFRNGADPAASFAHYLGQTDKLTKDVGPVTKEHAKTEAELMARGLQRASREFSYDGYVATVSVMNYGKRGLRVREQYQWLPEEPHAMR